MAYIEREPYLTCMDEAARRRWEQVLDPKVARRRLLVASLYIAAFEYLKEAVIEQIRDFFAGEFDESGPVESPRYRQVVLALDRNRLRASIAWLLQQGAINAADVASFDAARNLRNGLAHEMVTHVMHWPDDAEAAFDGLVSLLTKVERWWILNVEIPTSGSFDDVAVEAPDIVPGRVLMIRMLRDLALAPDDEAGEYLSAFQAMAGSQQRSEDLSSQRATKTRSKQD